MTPGTQNTRSQDHDTELTSWKIIIAAPATTSEAYSNHLKILGEPIQIKATRIF